MSNEVIARRLNVLSEILTPTGRYRNRVVRAGNDWFRLFLNVRINYDRSRFQDIRNGSTSNGCLSPLRQILGIDDF